MIVYNYENNSVVEKVLTDDHKTKIVGDISNKWIMWSEPIKRLQKDRQIMVDNIKPKKCGKDDKDWHSKIQLNRPYQYYSKLFGTLYETFYDKIPSYLKMGKENFDKVYPVALNENNKKELLVAVNDMLEYGEVVASAELKTVYEKRAFPISDIGTVDPASIVSVRPDSFVAKVETGREINFVRINPCNFAYDPLIVPGTKDFEDCDKIVKMWKTKQEILTNKSYEITQEELDSIIGTFESPNQESQDRNDTDVIYRYNQVEVLTYYGDFVIDGQYYNDYVAVVVAREKLVYFAPRNIYTPGIYYYPYHAIGNGARGVSPLYYILDLCELEQKTLNDSVDFLQLQKNPPCYAPAGFFEEEVTEMSPGKHITYRPGMQDPTAIIKIPFDAQPLMVYEAATAQLTEEIAGIDNGRLSEKSEALTQEEVRRIATNENLIPNMIISGIMLNIVSKYLTDCLGIVEGAEQETTLVKTAWEYANEQLQMQNVVAVLEKVASADPTMVNMQSAAQKVFESMGVNAAEYLNDGRAQSILSATGNLDDDVLQQLAEIGQELQVKKDNETKARKMMSQTQDNLYRKVLREAAEAGAMPTSVVLPDGQGSIEVPVLPVTPSTLVENRDSV